MQTQTVLEPSTQVVRAPLPARQSTPRPPRVAKTEAQTLMDTITKAAKDPSVDVNKLERLMAMYERIKAEQAKNAFNAALVAAKAEMPKVFKGAENSHTKSTYATLEGVSDAADPIITKHGFVPSYSTAECNKPGYYKVVCELVHREGHSKMYEAEIPSDGVGAKGNSNMNPVQGFGSTMSYGRRYLKLMIFDIATTDDDDANGGLDAVYITPEQVRELDQALRETKADFGRFLTYMEVPSLAAIPITRFHEAKTAIEAKRKRP